MAMNYSRLSGSRPVFCLFYKFPPIKLLVFGNTTGNGALLTKIAEVSNEPKEINERKKERKRG
jgi:hypothetical protein